MCFDIDVETLSTEELRDTLRRISFLLSKPTVVSNLPDKGHQLRLVKAKLEKEIKFRESLTTTRTQMHKLSMRCASDSNIDPHCSKLCSLGKKTERERFKPHYSLKPASGKSESMKELHSGTKLIDLTTSLSIQKEQEDRVKAEQIKAKQERLMNFLKEYDTDDSLSDDTADFNLSDYMSDYEEVIPEEEVDSLADDDEPGPSGLSKTKKPENDNTEVEDIIKENDNAEFEAEANKPKEMSGMLEKGTELEIWATELEMEPEELEEEARANTITEPTAEAQANTTTELTVEAEETKEEAEKPKAEVEEPKEESLDPKDEADTA